MEMGRNTTLSPSSPTLHAPRGSDLSCYVSTLSHTRPLHSHSSTQPTTVRMYTTRRLGRQWLRTNHIIIGIPYLTDMCAAQAAGVPADTPTRCMCKSAACLEGLNNRRCCTVSLTSFGQIMNGPQHLHKTTIQATSTVTPRQQGERKRRARPWRHSLGAHAGDLHRQPQTKNETKKVSGIEPTVGDWRVPSTYKVVDVIFIAAAPHITHSGGHVVGPSFKKGSRTWKGGQRI